MASEDVGSGAATTIDVAEELSAVAMLGELIRFDTTSRNSNLPLIRFVADYLAGHGVESTIIRSDCGQKANLFATIGPPDRAGVMLSGHTDVVPVDGQDWSSDPFVAVEREGRIYGRGSCDMKGFVALCLARVPDFVHQGLRAPVHLALTYDEEIDCAGARQLAATLRGLQPSPSLCVVGEPSQMKVVHQHKGMRVFHTKVTGREAHSSQPALGLNAITAAAELISYLQTLGLEMQERAIDAVELVPPHTTINVGRIEGGTVVNTVPQQCEFQWEYRTPPGDDEGEIIERFNAIACRTLERLRIEHPEADIETVELGCMPGFRTAQGSDAESMALELANARSLHAVSYGTEAGIYQRAGIPTVICGPGSVEQAHRADEFIDLSQIDAGNTFLGRLLRRLAAD